MIKTMETTKGQKPTPEQIKEIEEAVKHPIVFDEDCPELSAEMIRIFNAGKGKRRLSKEFMDELNRK